MPWSHGKPWLFFMPISNADNINDMAKTPIRHDGVAKQGQKAKARKPIARPKRKATAKKKKKKKKKSGNPNLIRRILTVTKEYGKGPLQNYRVLAPMVPCSARCLESHWSQGQTDAEAGKVKTLDFQFFQIIERSKSLAHLEAVEKIKEQIRKDPTAATAFKYLAITDRVHWAETHKHEVRATIESGQVSAIDECDAIQAARRKRFIDAKKKKK